MIGPWEFTERFINTDGWLRYAHEEVQGYYSEACVYEHSPNGGPPVELFHLPEPISKEAVDWLRTAVDTMNMQAAALLRTKRREG